MRFFIFMFLSVMLFGLEPIVPLHKVPYNEEKALLGKELFFDVSLSRDNSVGCVSCHAIYNGGADARVVSVGYGGRKGNIQSPTVLNAIFNFRQFWNGRAKDLYEQAQGPLLNPVEHNMTPELVVLRVRENKEYIKKFVQLYRDGVTFENVVDAIVEFEKALVTPSKFDAYLQGKTTLTKDEFKGYQLFKQLGCISCHNGINIGGNSFAKIGFFQDYHSKGKYPDRYAITKNPIDKNVYKVPTLRNIELTAPYFHNGGAKTLKEAIKAMGDCNLGVELSDEQLDLLEVFLKTLTGKLPKIAYE